MSQATGSPDRRFQPYPAYKDSAVEWLGEIPAHWDVKKVKRLCLVRRGASPRPIDDPIYFDDEGEYAWVRIADVTASERYLEYTTQRLSTLGKSKSVALEPGELFVSIAATVGKPVITKIKCCIHDGFVYFVGLHENREFLLYLFSCGEPYKGLGKLGTQLNLNTDTIGDIYLPRPSGAEQVAIVQFLDRKTAKIDALVAKKERLIELLEEKRAALITQAVTHGLPPEAARAAGLNPHRKVKSSGIDWLGDIPQHWEVKRLRRVGDAIIGLTYEPKDVVDQGDGVLVLRASNIVDGRIVLEDTVFVKTAIPERLITRVGDILICARSGSRSLIGKNAEIIEDSAGLTFGTFMLVFRSTYNDYLFYVFNSTLFDYQSGAFLTSTINQITVGNLYSFEVPIPPRGEQSAIASFLDGETAKIDGLIAKVRDAIAKLGEYRIALISAAVTGKIDVRTEAG